MYDKKIKKLKGKKIKDESQVTRQVDKDCAKLPA